MDIANGRFNIYLLSAWCAMLCCGCQTDSGQTKGKRVESVFRVHTEATSNTSFTRKIKVFRNSPTDMVVDQSPLLSEEQIKEARVVEALGGFAIAVKFDPRGQWLLDQYTSLNIGRHLAIFVQFGDKTSNNYWIAAPIVSSRISDGAIIFTPDATREEAEQIVQGLGPVPGQKQPEASEKW